jgi:cephalosporin hydroxylase
MCKDRPWGKYNNPKMAVCEFLRRLKEVGRVAADGNPLKFMIDRDIMYRTLITVAPDGHLRRI